VAVHEAVLRLLAREGAGFGMEDLAREAGVHKTTLYRRWASTAALMGEVAEELIGEDVRIPDTGGLEADLLAIGMDIAAVVAHPTHGPAMVALFTAPAGMREIHERIDDFWAARLALLQPVTDRAVARGEIPDGTDTGLMLESLAAPLYYRLFLTRRPVDEAAVRRSARVTVPAAAAGAFIEGDPASRRRSRPWANAG